MVKINKEAEQKIAQLQLIEQNLQNFMLQKQNFHAQLLEVENALTELKTLKEKPYKIVGSIMISTDKGKLEKDLSSKKEIINLRIKNIDKQEQQLKEKANEIQSEVMEELKKNE